MNLQFSFSAETEAFRLLDILAMIAEGFYTRNGFYVLPELKPELKNKPVIIVPSLQYFSYNEGWKSFEYKKNYPDLYVVNEKYLKKLATQLIQTQSFKELPEKSWQ